MRVRISTRLAWLDLTQVDFATAIGMDKSTFSRLLRADFPRHETLQRVALGLDLLVSDLDRESDPHALLRDHKALSPGMSRSDRAAAIRGWYELHAGVMGLPVKGEKQNVASSSE